MLFVCPNCATSYMIDQAAVGPAGRTVRCAPCKASWFAGGPETTPAVTSSVDTAIAEAEAQSAPAARVKAPQPPAAAPPPTAQAASDAGSEDSESIIVTETRAPPVEPPPREPAPAPVEAQAPETEPATIADAPPLLPIEHEALPETADAEPNSAEAEREVVSFDARRKMAADAPQAIAPAVALDCGHSRAGRLQRGASRSA
jgi:predicted Zn finger-like uncharacterized protein